MPQDYRLTAVEAASLSPYEIIEAVVWRIDADYPGLSHADESDVLKAKAVLDPIHFAVHAAWMTAGYAANGGVWCLIEVSARSYLEAAILGYELLGESQASRSLRVVLDTLDEAHSENIMFDDYYEQHEEEIPYVEFEGERNLGEFFRRPPVLNAQPAKFITPHQGEQVVVPKP